MAGQLRVVATKADVELPLVSSSIVTAPRPLSGGAQDGMPPRDRSAAALTTGICAAIVYALILDQDGDRGNPEVVGNPKPHADAGRCMLVSSHGLGDEKELAESPLHPGVHLKGSTRVGS